MCTAIKPWPWLCVTWVCHSTSLELSSSRDDLIGDSVTPDLSDYPALMLRYRSEIVIFKNRVKDPFQNDTEGLKRTVM